MKLALLEVLACPSCEGRFALESARTLGDSVAAGMLRCSSCARAFPISRGIPRLVPDANAVAGVKKSFQYQWLMQARLRYEPPGISYGFDAGELIDWMLATCAPGPAAARGCRWVLDAGCGNADKTTALAERLPNDIVLGFDLNAPPSLPEDRPNLCFVEADLRRPPFRPGVFDYVYSLGALHHAPGDTRAGFDALARLLAPGGVLATWTYPHPDEDDFWAALYRQRDFWFAGLGHRLPMPLLFALCHVYAPFTGPVKLPLRLLWDRSRADPTFPLAPARTLSPWQLYKSYVFATFDNLAPVHQRRHAGAEVAEWYRARGFSDVINPYPGFFSGHARSPAIRCPRSRLP